MKSIVGRLLSNLLPAVITALALAACQSVETTRGGVVGVDRSQNMLASVSSTEVQQAARQQYGEVLASARKEGKLDTKPDEVARVHRIVDRLIPQTTVFRPDARNWNWEAHVITSPEVNAWCMPGGKIAVYSGLIEKLHVTDAELAAVLGHEIAHALREHVRERMSEQAAAGSVISIGSALLGLGDAAQQGLQVLYMGAMGLPHSRLQETEADRIGVELAARAGYDPHAAVTLWQKMQQVGGSEPLPFLSTHPSSAQRLSDLRDYSQRVMPLYRKAESRSR